MLKKIREKIKLFFSSREKRIEYVLEGLKDLQTALKSNITTGALTATALLNASLAASLTTGKKAAITVLPEIIKILEILAAADDATGLNENIANVKKQLIIEGYTEAQAEQATETIKELLRDGKMTIKEVIILINYLKTI